MLRRFSSDLVAGTPMLKLKAVFISLFCVFVLTASGYAIYKAVGGPRLPWVGALLGAVRAQQTASVREKTLCGRPQLSNAR